MASGDNLSPALRDYVIDSIEIGEEIGRGAKGRILEAKWEGIAVAVICMYEKFPSPTYKRDFLRECEQSSRLRHPNIARFFGIYYPPGGGLLNLVMERLHCSLSTFLEQNPVVPIRTKLSVINDVALGLRYLHTRNPPIIHRELSSNNVLLSKGMEGKIGHIGIDHLLMGQSKNESRSYMFRSSTPIAVSSSHVDFMPKNTHYGRELDEELDVFSFGCVMLHTLSHEWPTPSEATIINPDTWLMTARTEVERRSKYFERIDKSRSDVLVPLIESCLSDLPKNRPSIVRVCDQLEGQLVDRESVATNGLSVCTLQQEIQQKDAELQRKDNEMQLKDQEIQRKDAELQKNYSEIQRKNTEIQHLTTALHDKDVTLETLKSDVSKLLQVTTPHLPSK